MSNGLPDTSAVRAPRRWWLHTFAWFGRWAIRRRYRVTVHGAGNVPASGPVILASNHIGVIDGPLLAIFGPRPAHVLTKDEMFHGVSGRFFSAVGQISLWRGGADPGAIKACVKVLRDGGVVGIFPEGTRGAGRFDLFHHGAAYLAMVTGAPVVPVTMLGSRDPGGGRNSLPRKGAHIDIVFGRPWTTEQVPWPRTREHVRAVSALLRGHLLAQVALAEALTGRDLPGAIPDPEPTTPDDGARTGAAVDVATTTVPDQGAS
ncbi:lysophospholipid acyltransferase family protein [Nocardioides nematodiphilus]|uniref:lysophospholipid acyltransferase family protein n=1 Tax=Nocardioides nematodiphilus TaxID=2849669 RepID=UPI001CDA064F|nr:lysophospholipid acyltransferase family protein [Nocardioides nematodiphilus]MCA1983694.1 1-acyl-sn-glycerol-3-phosphate acyltransferase [Nocardioides nematodiphilus]